MEFDSGGQQRMTARKHDQPPRTNRVSRALAYFLTFAITFLFVDFFQVKESARHGSFDQFNRYFATTYPECIPRSVGEIFRCMFEWETAGQSDNAADPMVSVVLWTDAMLTASSKAWPIRMEDHARVLETILRLQPKGVLVDLFFLDDPEIRGDPTLQDLIDVICDYHETSETETVSRLYLIKPHSTRDAGDSGTESDSGPRIASKLTDGVQRECGLDLATSEVSDAVRMVPAILSHVPSRIYPKHGAAAEMFSPNSGLEDFHIFWANSANQMFLDQERCMRGASVFPDDIMEVFTAVAARTMDSFLGKSTAETPCPYPPVISAHVMHCLRTTAPDKPLISDLQECGLTENQHDAIKRGLDGKYAIYGAELHGLGDLYDVPIHDNYKLSGVFIHAMALDNLLETGGTVHLAKTEHRAWSTKLMYYAVSALLATILFFIAKCVFFHLWHRFVHDIVQARSIPLRLALLAVEMILWMAFVILSAGALIFVTWTLYRLSFLYEPFRFGIMNWVGILVVSGLLAIWVKQPFADELAEILQAGGGRAKSRLPRKFLRVPRFRRGKGHESR